MVLTWVGLVALAWALLWQPLTARMAALRAAAPQRDAQLAEAKRFADEIAGLARSARPPASATDAERALAAAFAGLGATWEARGDTVRVTAGSISFASLVAALEAVQTGARLVPVEATLTARIEPGTVRAEVALGRPATPRN